MSEEPSRAAKIFLVDDHPAIRQGLSVMFVQAGHTVCGEAASIAEAASKLPAAQPDVVLVDISLDNESGFDLLEMLRKQGMRSLVYSMHGSAATIEQAFNAGAGGYVTKCDNTESLLDAIRDVLAGRRHVSSRAAQSLAEKVLKANSSVHETLLSDREQVVVALLQKAHTTPEIADELNISPRTVESYYARIIGKLKLNGMRGLRRYAFGRSREPGPK